ncbi:FAM78A [Bugula neritina]|uniref:FAM78A n=1 Tax=Bugula neritina TaxID=10212 RepID=A0A7J7J5D0_BUGNE|nr:FAM78A [Bugula neritina]
MDRKRGSDRKWRRTERPKCHCCTDCSNNASKSNPCRTEYGLEGLECDPALLKSSRHSIRAKLFQLLRSGPTPSTRKRPDKLPQNLDGLVTITNLSATIDEKPTSIDERSQAVLKYRTPHFRASATVKVPQIPEQETWQVGWIQACTDMVFLNTYGSYGVSSWEFPELKTGGYPMISDSDGRNYPWYGSRTEVVTIAGPTKHEQTVTVTMNDNFYPHITWSVPLRNHRTPALTHVRRTQDHIYILKTIRWNMHLEIAVDPNKPLGQRARLLGSGIQNQPTALNYNVEIARCALHPPNANSAQNLIWYPATGNMPPEIIVPAKWNPDEKKEEAREGL